MRYLSCFLVIVTCTSITASCGTDAGPEVLDNPRGTFEQNSSFKLVVHDGLLYAGTEGGLFRKPVDPAATEWESLGLGNSTIQTFLVFSRSHLLVSSEFADRPTNSTIARTTNGGGTYWRACNGYNSESSADINIPRDMQMHPSDPELLFAGGPGFLSIARSTDQGGSWEQVSGPFFGFLRVIHIDANNPQIIWSGGSDGFFLAALFKSTDGGDTFEFLPPPTVAEANVYDLLVRPGRSEWVLAGTGGGFEGSNVISRSTDGGQNWDIVLDGFFIRTMAHSARDAETVYASGINIAGTLFFVQSSDFSDTWEEIEVPGAPGDIIVRDMVSVMVGGREVLYFATTKGVYSYTFEE